MERTDRQQMTAEVLSGVLAFAAVLGVFLLKQFLIDKAEHKVKKLLKHK